MQCPPVNWTLLLEASMPAALPTPWRRVPCHPAFVQLPDAERVQQLVDAFVPDRARETLESLAWLTPGSREQQQLELHPALQTTDNLVMAIKTAPDSCQAEVYSGVSWDRAPLDGLVAPLRDVRTPRGRRDIDMPPTLFGAFSLAELACLWSAGFPAVLGTELVTADKQLLQRLTEAWRALRTSRASDAGGSAKPVAGGTKKPDEPLSLVLVDFSLVRLEQEPRPQVIDVIQHLQQMQRCCDVDLELSVWRPASAELADLRFAVEFGDSEDIASQIAESVNNSARELEDEPSGDSHPPTVKAPPTYAAAIGAFEAARRQRADRQQLERQWHVQREAWLREFFAPLMQQAELAKDAIVKGDWSLLADAHSQWQLLRVPDPTQHDSAERQAAPAEVTKRQQQLLQTIQDFSKRIRAWQASEQRQRLPLLPQDRVFPQNPPAARVPSPKPSHSKPR